jgi:hypothetical protein
MAEAVLTVANNMQSTGSWRRRSIGACLAHKKILQTSSRRYGSDSFQKGTALHGASFRYVGEEAPL